MWGTRYWGLGTGEKKAGEAGEAGGEKYNAYLLTTHYSAPAKRRATANTTQHSALPSGTKIN
ncbi:hypothetical protein [Anabaena sp. CCY 9402-a]|uniref:hypothetical protein n=1 Tax=Anabaena sp. CCY 9402-a TaxID=3103867 RepID=UPI0039C5E98D